MRLEIDAKYFDELKRIQTEAENARYEEELKNMGLSGKRKEEMTAEQQAALELLNSQHKMNLDKIETESQKRLENNLQKREDARLEEMRHMQEMELNLIKTNADTQEKAIEANYQAELLSLKEKRAKQLLTQEEYDEEEKKLARRTAQEKLEVAEAEYRALLQLSDTPERKKEIEDLLKRINELKMELADLDFSDPNEFSAKRQSALEKYGLTTLADQQAMELAALKQAYEEKLLSEEEYQKARLQVQLKYGQEYTKKAQEMIKAGSELVSALEEAETAKVSAEYAQREAALTEQYNNGLINQEEYNARKEQLDYEQRSAELEIQKKYADANFAMQVAQIIAATSLAAMNAYSAMAGIPYVGPVLGGIAAAAAIAAGAVQIAAAKAERDRVKSLTLESPSGGNSSTPTGSLIAKVDQAADGRYDVMGRDDGVTYRNVPYGGVMRTGVVSHPTLVGERGDEVVIDHPTLQNLRMNAPYVLDTIMRHRVGQRMEGNYESISTPSKGVAAENGELLKTLALTNSLLNRLLNDPLMAYVVLSQLEAKQQLKNRSEKKGSIK